MHPHLNLILNCCIAVEIIPSFPASASNSSKEEKLLITNYVNVYRQSLYFWEHHSYKNGFKQTKKSNINPQ